MKRTEDTAKVLLPFEMKKLLAWEIITEEEHQNLMDMIESEDPADTLMAEGIVNTLRTKRLRKQSRSK